MIFKEWVIRKMEGVNPLEVVDIDCAEFGLTDLIGIEKFTNLKKLNCYGNYITSLKGMENLVRLEQFVCSYNELTSLKGIENLTNLTSINASNNKLTSLEAIENLSNLNYLHLIGNNLSPNESIKIPFSKLVSLKWDNNIPIFSGMRLKQIQDHLRDQVNNAYRSFNEMKYIKMFENFDEREIDSGDYFDFGSLQMYVEFDKPLYSIIAKHKTAKLVYMSPKQYMYTIARFFGGLSYDDTMLAVSDDKVSRYAKDMKNGDKFPIGHYSESGLQEGRHRALAAMELGCDKIPMIEFINLDNDELLDIVNTYKDMDYVEIDESFKSKGFNGITQLGYRELKRYVEYNII